MGTTIVGAFRSAAPPGAPPATDAAARRHDEETGSVEDSDGGAPDGSALSGCGDYVAYGDGSDDGGHQVDEGSGEDGSGCAARVGDVQGCDTIAAEAHAGSGEDGSGCAARVGDLQVCAMSVEVQTRVSASTPM